ncbi:hypothetical protein GUITHDRAFT_102497 [Guillardia theta CCMP2712]|uniref:PH domain-containing protein n=1 Tax=Guillardia theta (strain CCMP2712) TaxID=905079 RepID=L1JTZ4_GUITC|nr:hypothetical protein GUITHDRAFT_102497 [Guillardia theta CCMP2712]EKX51882.1 hypothetical protein GUITHDRAFT_102497 [Guillardia theta CCMP2712]|eukprot:XP_005838862.1 hypothetical protein GUITHDRAFT_102497 [Guillardia theta CCMP2712]
MRRSEISTWQLLQVEDDNEFLPKACRLLENFATTKHGLQEKMLKLGRHGKSAYTYVYLSAAHDWICWNPSSIVAKALASGTRHLEVSHIVRVEVGQNTTNFNRKTKVSSNEQISKSFSVVTHDRSLDLIAKTEDIAKLWVRTLKLLVNKQLLQDGRTATFSTGNHYRRYLMEQWNRADEDRSENLTLEEVTQLLRKMNVMAKRKWIREQAMKADNSHFSLDATQFLTFMNNLMGNRADVKNIMREIHRESGGNSYKEELLNAKQLCQFMNTYQKSSTDEQWTEIGAGQGVGADKENH